MSSKIGAGASFGGSAVPTVAGMEGQDVNSEINVTPMIDVMLVLLIIFMVITPALAGYTAVLPKAVTAAPEKEERVTLGIDNNGLYYLEDGPQGAVPPEALEQVLRDAYASRPEDHILYLKADANVNYSVVLTAIDAARKAGVVRIGAITEMPAEEVAKRAREGGS
jgi:biopolymer transport protein ExbD/biopolymer transport protein TolR